MGRQMTEGAVSAANGVGMSQNRLSPCGVYEKIAPPPAEFAKITSPLRYFRKNTSPPAECSAWWGDNVTLLCRAGTPAPTYAIEVDADVGSFMEFSF